MLFKKFPKEVRAYWHSYTDWWGKDGIDCHRCFGVGHQVMATLVYCWALFYIFLGVWR